MALRRNRTTLLGAAVLAAALALAGCTGTGSDDVANGEAPLSGIDATSVTIGFSIVDLGEVTASIGFEQADYGGYDVQKKAFEALVADVNANGGMGGRQVRAVFNRYVGMNDSPQQSEEQCKLFTQDEQVAAAVLDGGFQNNTVPCFVGNNTLLVLQSLIAQDQTSFEQNSPYLWSPSNPEYGAFLRAQLEAMDAAGFFDDASGVLLMPSDDEVSRRVTSTIAEPFLRERGVSNVVASYVDSTNVGTLGETGAQAIQTGKNRGLDRVIAIGGARIAPFTLSLVDSKDFDSRWGVSSYDSPFFTAHNDDNIQVNLRIGMTGLGFSPAQDVDDGQGPAFPDPANPAQQQCVETIRAAGAQPPGEVRANWKNALYYCDAVRFLDAALDQLPGVDEVTGNQFRDAVAKIDSSYDSALTFGSQWGPGVYAGTNTAMTMSWNQECRCFEYTGEPITFGPGAGPATAPGTSDGTSTGTTPAPTAPTTPGGAASPAAASPADAWPSS